MDLGKTRNTNLLMSEDDTKRVGRIRRNMINPKSLPRLKEERKGTLERDLSLKNIIREQLSTVKFNSHKMTPKGNTIPKSVTGSIHLKKKFDTVKKPAAPPQMIYSKSDLLKMILDNDEKQSKLK